MKKKKDFSENVWEDGKTLDGVFKFIKEATTGKHDWWWIKNSKCKYVSLRIDMRDGGFIILDRNNERIEFTELEYQYQIEDNNE